ncbi:long-chain-fatty-acid--CoA ligase [[Mycobacterium] burgundiense]|uniref:Long-chain-fatty-acid--CoA ligase n=1 Tax=[Mycobacterium] burgundiense TaxID=3064286 RepID=A0ABN9N8V8_9MYCO|nr:long-chain-fatty-acid--CoA ligase [Mycolicibacterium sp. MU0053]CAJ1500606.1 long-chain-fatty-acid--CoA ligase [Mycolicibacterium sp. MU0053]
MYMTAALHRTLQRHPERPHTIFGTRIRTVAESADRIARLAGALRSLGVSQGSRVGMLGHNSDRYHEYLLAVPWAGAVVNPCNVRWNPDEISYALRESDTRWLFVDEVFLAMVPALRARYEGLTTVIYCGDGACPAGMLDYEELIDNSVGIPDSGRHGDDLFGIFYTGGTTGHPKGVMLSHRNMLTSATGSIATTDFLTRNGRVLHAAPMFHLGALSGWTAALLSYCTHVIVPAFSADAVLEAIETHRVNDLRLVPTMMHMLLEHENVSTANVDSVQHISYGASPISQPLLHRVRERFPSARFIQAYGMTELSPVACMLSPEDHDDPALERSCGLPAAHVEVRIIDEDDKELPRGSIGEVAVRGDNVMLGYLNRPADTAAVLRDGWMHTGDAGYMDERGYVFIVDRIKDMVITGGENVYSAEVENVLAQQESVAQCAVIGVPDDKWGERLHAVVVTRAGAAVTEAQLQGFCRERMAGYKIPRSVAFVDVLPMSAAGKVLKRLLREQYSLESTQR